VTQPINRMSFTSDHLIDQIIRGEKTASAETIEDQGELDEWDSALGVGIIYVVCDSKRTPRCRIKVNRIELCRWDDIPEWLWRGETNHCAQEFRDDHDEFFDHPAEGFEFVGYRFECVEVL